MKRTITILIAVFILLPCIPAAAQTAADTQAWETIYRYVETELGYTQDQLIPGQLVYAESSWAFSLMVKDHPETEDGLIVGEMDGQGTITSLQAPQEIPLDRQLELDLKSCFNQDDCYLRLPVVCQKWLPVLNSLSTEQLDWIFDKYRAVVRLHIAIPPDNAIPYPDAYDAAIHVLAQQPGWNADMAQMFRLAISAYYTPQDIGKPVYFFYFEQHSPLEPAYTSKAAREKYWAALESAFGGPAPNRFSIMIDAMDGSLVHQPLYDYAPIRFHYLDFLIRTDAMIEAEEQTQL